MYVEFCWMNIPSDCDAWYKNVLTHPSIREINSLKNGSKIAANDASWRIVNNNVLGKFLKSVSRRRNSWDFHKTVLFRSEWSSSDCVPCELESLFSRSPLSVLWKNKVFILLFPSFLETLANSKPTAYEPAINEVVVPVLNRDLCNEWLDSLNVTEGMICAGYEVGRGNSSRVAVLACYLLRRLNSNIQRAPLGFRRRLWKI